MDEKTSAFPIINGRYKILNTIATGGMSIIYRAEDIMLERLVAVKVLRKDLSTDKTFRKMFESEAKATAKLSHPNIVTTFDFGLDSNRLFIVMELITGCQLKDLISEKKITSIPEGYSYIIQVCEGLAYAHKMGIIHCDIKPQNILVSEDNILKITDFGISRALESISRAETISDIWGSPYYLSPEVSAGKVPSPASDIYSLGVIMYEVFTGVKPFDGDDVLTLLEKHQTGKLVPPNSINPRLSDQLNSLITRALGKTPKLRYQSGGDLLDALQMISENLVNSFVESPIDPDLEEGLLDDNKKIIVEEGKHDWVSIMLSIAAILAIGGLIPFWLIIYYTINR